MSEIPQWAKDKAREWLNNWERDWTKQWREQMEPDLAALLVEVVREKQYGQWQEDQHVTAEELTKQRAEVRRVVEEVLETPRPIRSELWNMGRENTCTEILARLEKL